MASNINKYLSNVQIRTASNEIDKFIAISHESEHLSGKIEEEKADNLRLAKKLEDLDSQLSWLLVNQIGNAVSLECEYVDTKTAVCQEKTQIMEYKAQIVQNKAENIVYSDKIRLSLEKVKSTLQRKIDENKAEKERLVQECADYQENRVHLKPLAHQYSEIMKQIRIIDKQVTQLMK